MKDINRELIGKRLKERRELKGLTQEQVGEKIGKTFATVAKYESGEIKNIDIMVISTIADLTNTDIDYLLLKTNLPSNLNIKNNNATTFRIPILGRVVAGVPMEVIEEHIGYEEIDPKLAKAGEFFALIIKGNSMEPHFFEGDIVIVKKISNVENGDIAVVLVNGEEATVKRIMKDSNGITLVPFNNAYLPRFYPNEEIEKLPVQIIGRVMENRRKY